MIFFELKFRFLILKLMLIFAKLRKYQGLVGGEEDPEFRVRKYLNIFIVRFKNVQGWVQNKQSSFLDFSRQRGRNGATFYFPPSFFSKNLNFPNMCSRKFISNHQILQKFRILKIFLGSSKVYRGLICAKLGGWGDMCKFPF